MSLFLPIVSRFGFDINLTFIVFLLSFAKMLKKSSSEKQTVFCWEINKDVEECYICDSKFTTMHRRHHCRCCGTIICSNCCQMGHVTLQNRFREIDPVDVACIGCYYGETPGKWSVDFSQITFVLHQITILFFFSR